MSNLDVKLWICIIQYAEILLYFEQQDVVDIGRWAMHPPSWAYFQSFASLDRSILWVERIKLNKVFLVFVLLSSYYILTIFLIFINSCEVIDENSEQSEQVISGHLPEPLESRKKHLLSLSPPP